jgi:O-antigen ligase
LLTQEGLRNIDTTGRLGVWEYAWQYIAAGNLVLGRGIGAVGGYLSTYSTLQVHNDYLRVLGDLGLIGVGLVLLNAIYLVRKLFRIWGLRERADDRLGRLVPAGVAALAIYLLVMLTDNPLDYYFYTTYVFTLLGMAFAWSFLLSTRTELPH